MVHKKKSFTFVKKPSIFLWICNYQFYDICAKYIKKEYHNIFEIGCAPGNYLIDFKNKFNLEIHGIEYSEEGIHKLQENFQKNNIQANIIHGDFFDDTFLKENFEKYDIVYSWWFIEHFDNVEDVIQRHFDLTKKWGLVIISIPNFQYINKTLMPKNIVDMHNLSIMDLPELRKIFAKYDTLKIRYFGGRLNTGLFFYKNRFLEKIRFLFFLLQRVVIDPIFIILYKLGLDLSNKYSSPQIIIVCRKK